MQIHQALIPMRVSGISREVRDACLGLNHSVMLLDHGQVVTFGSNEDSQLGQRTENSTPRSMINVADFKSQPAAVSV